MEEEQRLNELFKPSKESDEWAKNYLRCLGKRIEREVLMLK